MKKDNLAMTKYDQNDKKHYFNFALIIIKNKLYFGQFNEM
jgi:hypothetical protein